jgi:hypothetical protein
MDEPRVDSGMMQRIFGDCEGIDDSANPDSVLHDPFGKFFESAEIDHAIAVAPSRGAISLDFLKTETGDVDTEEFALDPVPTIAKAEPSASRNTFAKKLGVTRSEVATAEDGTRWMRGFDAGGTLVDARVLLPATE